MFKKRPRLPYLAFVIFVLIFLLGSFGWNSLTLAQGSTSQLEYRISRLESQVSQLSAQLNSVRNQGSAPTVIEVQPGAEMPRPSDGNRLLSGDPMFDRLAILVVETKQDVQQLQKQVAALEAQLQSIEGRGKREEGTVFQSDTSLLTSHQWKNQRGTRGQGGRK